MEIYGRKRKSVAGQVIGIIICLILFVAALAIGVLGLISEKDGEMPSLMGRSIYSAYMHTANIPDHAAVIVDREAAPVPGQAVLFKYPGYMDKDMSVAYMMSDNSEGIAVAGDDASMQVTVAAEDVRGVVTGYIPVLGSVLSVAQSVYGGLLFLLLAFFLLLMVIMFGFKISERRNRHDQNDDDIIGSIGNSETAYAENPEEKDEALVFVNDIVSDEHAAEPDGDMRMVAAASGDAAENYVSLIINAPEEDIEKIKTVIENGLKQKAADEWEIRRVRAQQPTLAIRCSWQDLAVVSLLISALKKAK